MTRQFAPGDRLLIRATATDVTAAQLSRGENAWLRVGQGDVVEASGTVTEAEAERVYAAYCVKIGLFRTNERDHKGVEAMRAALEAATLARPALAPRVPEEIVRLSEKATPGLITFTELEETSPHGKPWPSTHARIEELVGRPFGDVTLEINDARFLAACWNFTRSIIATSPDRANLEQKGRDDAK